MAEKKTFYYMSWRNPEDPKEKYTVVNLGLLLQAWVHVK